MWTREEDIQHDIYRPVYLDRLSASVSNGRIVGWKHRITGSSVIARWLPPAFQKGIDIDAIDSAADIPYDIANLRVEYVRAEPPAVPTGFWRGVGPNNNVFAIESFMDELARKSRKDPVAFRRDLLDKTPRLKAALDLAAEKAGWGSPLPLRTGRGVAVQAAFGSFIATVAQAEVDEHGEVRVQRIVSAVDTGIVVNPDTVIAQLQGGLVFGLTAALYGNIDIEKGRGENALCQAEIDASADKALSRFYTLNPKHKELVNKAAGILIFGRVTKGGAGVAGEFGEGVLRVNGKTVDYYSIGSASVALTLGVAKHSKIIAFMTRDSLDEFTKSEGWSASLAQNIALVSKGAGDEDDTATLGKPILGFIFHEKGLLTDLSFEGSKISKIKTTD